MSVDTLCAADFDAAVETAATLVVEFAPGQPGTPAAHPLAAQFPDVTFARVDSGRDPEVAAMFGLAAEPALLIFRDRIVLYLEAGPHDPERIAGLLGQVCALDMDQVRARIEEDKRAEIALQMRRVCPTARRGPLGSK